MTAADLTDERLRRAAGLRGSATAFVDRVRAGELGMVPVVAGLLVICVVLQILNPIFLSSTNLVNLLMECVPVGIIALGIVCVLLVGQIDLSVGSISGLAAAIMAILFVKEGWPAWLAVLVALLTGGLIGLLYAGIYNRVGIPTFVITLAGLLSFLGLQLKTLGAIGSVNLPFDSGLVEFAQLRFVPPALSYVLVLLAAAGLFVVGSLHASRRRTANLSARSLRFLMVRSGILAAGLGFAAWYLNRTRGIGWMFVLFVALAMVLHYALTSTKWGKAVYAVGGNVEAARRAGVNVRLVYTSAFAICTTLAAFGGILGAARLAAANQASGGGDVNLNAIAAAVIGGTSLFGGRGSAFAAVLGVLVIQSISSGLTLLSLDSSYRFFVTGVVLLLAVGVDSLARRTRTSHGRA